VKGYIKIQELSLSLKCHLRAGHI